MCLFASCAPAHNNARASKSDFDDNHHKAPVLALVHMSNMEIDEELNQFFVYHVPSRVCRKFHPPAFIHPFVVTTYRVSRVNAHAPCSWQRRQRDEELSAGVDAATARITAHVEQLRVKRDQLREHRTSIDSLNAQVDVLAAWGLVWLSNGGWKSLNSHLLNENCMPTPPLPASLFHPADRADGCERVHGGGGTAASGRAARRAEGKDRGAGVSLCMCACACAFAGSGEQEVLLS
jgi:hypothetical protein